MMLRKLGFLPIATKESALSSVTSLALSRSVTPLPLSISAPAIVMRVILARSDAGVRALSAAGEGG